MFIVEELAFPFVENRWFKHFCSILNPIFSLPSRRTFVWNVYQLYIDEKGELKKYLFQKKKKTSIVCLTIDT